jgi:hypothetical protein
MANWKIPVTESCVDCKNFVISGGLDDGCIVDCETHCIKSHDVSDVLDIYRALKRPESCKNDFEAR